MEIKRKICLGTMPHRSTGSEGGNTKLPFEPVPEKDGVKRRNVKLAGQRPCSTPYQTRMRPWVKCDRKEHLTSLRGRITDTSFSVKQPQKPSISFVENQIKSMRNTMRKYSAYIRTTKERGVLQSQAENLSQTRTEPADKESFPDVNKTFI